MSKFRRGLLLWGLGLMLGAVFLMMAAINNYQVWQKMEGRND